MFPQPVNISATSESPKVQLDLSTQTFSISGRSLPENPHDFYQPVITWLEMWVKENSENLELSVQFDYFNSSSGRYLLEMFQVFEKNGAKDRAKIIWNVDEDDELMLEKGEEYILLLDCKVEIRQN